MLARLLFACVWLVIAAAVLLPLSPIDVPAPEVATLGGPIALADASTDAAACGRSCSELRRRGIGAMAAPICLDFQLRLVIQPAPATPPALLKRLPAI